MTDLLKDLSSQLKGLEGLADRASARLQRAEEAIDNARECVARLGNDLEELREYMRDEYGPAKGDPEC